MSNQTLRKPTSKPQNERAAKSVKRSRSALANRYRRQAGRGGLEYRRDGQPLIFGWGRHLSRIEKSRIKTRAAYAFLGVIIAAVVFVGAFGILQQNVLIPNQTIISVNGTTIAQDTYRKYLAYESQVLWNRLQSEIQQEKQLSAQANAGNTAAAQQDQTMISLIQSDESNYAQSQITTFAGTQLLEDQIIQQGIATFGAQHVPASNFAVSAKSVDSALQSFKKAFPSGQSYAKFLAANQMSNGDVLAAIRVDLRRNVMQTYLSSLIVSPTKQVHLRRIQIDTLSKANALRAQLVKDSSDANWTKLAKADSLDATTKTVGGDMGWIFRGNSDAEIENWAFNPNTKVGSISPIIKDVGGTYNVVQMLAVDPKRAVDPSSLSGAQSNALSHWLNGQKAAPGAHVTGPDQNMLTANRNLPVMPNLNANLPSYSTPAANPSQGG